VTLLCNHEGAIVVAAAEHLQRHGRRAIPTIEGAMHTASVPGRKNLILALRQIGDGEAVPLLRHVALYDASAEVQREALWTLKKWAQGQDARAEAARAAVRAVDEERQSSDTG
jgi:hypothetical protein